MLLSYQNIFLIKETIDQIGLPIWVRFSIKVRNEKR